MSILGLELTPDPEKDAKNRRKDIKKIMTGVERDPVEKKEQHKPHPDDPTMGDDKPSIKI